MFVYSEDEAKASTNIKRRYDEMVDAFERYKKVWNAFCAKKNAIKSDRRVITLMREKTITAMEAADLTAYTICKNLNLNIGNVYAYLHSGDVTKVSRATARKIMQFAVNSEAAIH